MAGLDKEVIKSVTEKLEVEQVEESADVKRDIKGGDGTEAAPVDGSINKGGEKIEKDEKSEEQEKAPVDSNTNVGGVTVAEAEEIAQMRNDLETLKEEYAKLASALIVEEDCDKKCDKEEDEKEEDDKEEADESLEEALSTLLAMVKEAYEQTAQMKSDFDTLKEEYAKLVAEKIIAESDEADEVAMESEDDKEKDEDKADNHRLARCSDISRAARIFHRPPEVRAYLDVDVFTGVVQAYNRNRILKYRVYFKAVLQFRNTALFLLTIGKKCDIM